MSKKKEILNVLKAEIILTARQVLNASSSDDFSEIIKELDKLYQKVAAYKYLSDHFPEEIYALEDKSTPKKESDKSNPPKREISSTDNLQKESGESTRKISIDPDNKAIIDKVMNTSFKPKQNKSVQPVQIGLADKIAFLKNLFDNNVNAYEAFTKSLDEAGTLEEAMQWIETYSGQYKWKKKGEYMERLKQIVEAKFS